jgi:outer membrane protein assembly factor BamE
MSRLAPALALVACTAMLAGCSALQRTDSLLGVITPYRIDIVQGNAITREQITLIRPGLTRLQVREILGTPLLTDPFHGNRWDYFFTLRRPNAEPQKRHVVVIFEGEVVRSVQAPDLPSEQEFVASISRMRNVRVPRLELTPEEQRALPAPVRRQDPAPEPMGPVREYPPLEPG